MLRAENVSMSYGRNHVLEDISIGVEPGEVLTIVGPSGTGKSTLLRLFAMFQPSESGRVLWGDSDVWALPEDERLRVRRQVSMVFQEPNLFNAPVARNVTYGERVRSPWPERFRRQLATIIGEEALPGAARDALETVGLLEMREQNALSLSGGEAQRVAFARALTVQPRVMLLDEPTSNLDPRNTAVLEAAIRRAKARDVGIVVATHDMHQAERISDRVGFIYEGELIETGPPEQLFENPRDARTKQFVDGELLYEADNSLPPA